MVWPSPRSTGTSPLLPSALVFGNNADLGSPAPGMTPPMPMPMPGAMPAAAPAPGGAPMPPGLAPSLMQEGDAIMANPLAARQRAMQAMPELFQQDTPLPDRAGDADVQRLAEGVASPSDLARMQGRLQAAQQLAATPEQYATRANPFAPAFAGIKRAIGAQMAGRIAGEVTEAASQRSAAMTEALVGAETPERIARIAGAFGASQDEVQWRMKQLSETARQRNAMAVARMNAAAGLTKEIFGDLSDAAGGVRDLQLEDRKHQHQLEQDLMRGATTLGTRLSVIGAMALTASGGNKQRLSQLEALMGEEPGTYSMFAPPDMAGESPMTSAMARQDAGTVGIAAFTSQENRSVAGWAYNNPARVKRGWEDEEGNQLAEHPFGLATFDLTGLTGQDLKDAKAARSLHGSEHWTALLHGLPPGSAGLGRAMNGMYGTDRLLDDSRLLVNEQREIQNGARRLFEFGTKLALNPGMEADPSSIFAQLTASTAAENVPQAMLNSARERFSLAQAEVPASWHVRSELHEQFKNPTPALLTRVLNGLKKHYETGARPFWWPDNWSPEPTQSTQSQREGRPTPPRRVPRAGLRGGGAPRGAVTPPGGQQATPAQPAAPAPPPAAARPVRARARRAAASNPGASLGAFREYQEQHGAGWQQTAETRAGELEGRLASLSQEERQEYEHLRAILEVGAYFGG